MISALDFRIENLRGLDSDSYHGLRVPGWRLSLPRDVTRPEVCRVIELIEEEEVEDLETEGEGGSALEPAELSAADRNGSVSFFKNWVWWVSLIAAVPAGFLAVSMVLTAIDYGAQWNWVMVIVAALTFICACAALVTPLLLALGFMLGGKPMTGPPMPVQAPASSEAVFAEDDEIDEDESVDDMFDDDTDADEDEFVAEFEDDDFDSDDDFEL